MASVDKFRILRSAEEVAFARCYKDLFEEVSLPIKLAEVLFSEDIISSETKNSITSDADKQALFDFMQKSLSQAKDPHKVMKKLINALEEIDVDTDHMQEFIDGKQNYSVKASVII